MSHRSALIRLGAFLGISVLFASYLIIVLGDVRFGGSQGYKAVFANVSGLKSGDAVKIAGVEVGKVTSVAIDQSPSADQEILVGFTVDSGIPLEQNIHATIRFKDLIGDTYLELERGTTSAAALASGATLPASQTSAALDLNTLYDGFQPLFQGLDPAQINQVATAIVNVLQGQGGAIYELIGTLASLTSTFASNDQLISSVITNLQTAIGTVAAHQNNFGDIVSQLQTLVSGLSADRAPIGDAIVHINDLAGAAAGLISQARPNLLTDVSALNAVATTLNQNTDSIQQILTLLPGAYQRLARAGSFGNFFNFYLCGLRYKLDGPSGQPYYTPFTVSDAARCTN